MRTTASSGGLHPIFVHDTAPPGASRRAAVIAAAYTALASLFPSRQAALDASYAASLAALSDDAEDGGKSRERGNRLGHRGGQPVLAWRAADGFSGSYPAFRGGADVGQWRPTPPLFGPMSAQGLAFTSRSSWSTTRSFNLIPREALSTGTYAEDFNAVKALGRRTGSRGLKTRRRLRRSGRATPAFIGIRRQTRLRGRPPVDVPQQPTFRPSEPRDGRYRLHDLEREAILWRDTDGSDLAPGDRHSSRRDDRNPRPLRTSTGCLSSTRRRTRSIPPGIRAKTGRQRPSF